MYFCNISSPKIFSPRPQLHTPTVLSPYCLSFLQSDMGHQNFVECILVHMFNLIDYTWSLAGSKLLLEWLYYPCQTHQARQCYEGCEFYQDWKQFFAICALIYLLLLLYVIKRKWWDATQWLSTRSAILVLATC
jgi:hypothetical protein